MRDKLLAIAGFVGLLAIAYGAGYETAQAYYQHEATLAHQKAEDASRRASDALSHLSKVLGLVERADDETLRRIEDAAKADGAVCNVPVDRLRPLDQIG